ncbi:MAG: hypothetical protein NVS1B11_24590 [Terriglobales bacterium]
MINIIVIVITAIGVGLVLVWILSPNFRRWSELPKYRMLEQDQKLKDHPDMD